MNLVCANIRQRPIRTLISVISVALGVALVMLFTGFTRGMSNDMQRRATNWRAEILFTRPGAMELTSSTASVSTAYVERLKKIEGVADAIPVITYISAGKAGFGFEQIDGVDWAPFARMNQMQILEGRAPQENTEVIIDETRRSEEHKVGGTIRLFGDRDYRIVGIFAPQSGARIKMTLNAMQDVLEAPGKCTYILVKCNSPEIEEIVARRINDQLPGNKIQLARELIVSAEKRIPYLAIFQRTLVGLAGFVSTIFVMLAMYTTIVERTREIGILKALGASRRFIIGIIEQEATLIGLMGLVLGFAATFIIGRLIHQFYGLSFEFSWLWALAAALIGLLGSALGALYPAMRAASLDPVEALAEE